MNKKILEQFINKYNLSGMVEAVKWRSDTTGLHTNFISPEKSVIGFLSTPQIVLSSVDKDFNIADTVSLRKMLAPLSETVDVKVTYANDKPFSLIMSDGFVKSTLILSSPGAVPVPVPMQGLRDDLVLEFAPLFITTYMKACSAVQDSDTVTFVSDGTTAQAILGYDPDAESSNIAINLTVIKASTIAPITFPSRPLREVLSANSEMSKGRITVDARGIAHVVCDLSAFTAEYYLTRKNG